VRKLFKILNLFKMKAIREIGMGIPTPPKLVIHLHHLPLVWWSKT